MNSTALSQTQTGAEAYTDLSSVQAINTIKDKDLALEKVAEQFESMMMRMMIKSMRAANDVFAEGNYLSSHEGDMYRDMLDDQLSLNLSKGRGMGIAEVMVRQLKGRFGDGTAADKSNIHDLTDYLEQRMSIQSADPGVVRGINISAQKTTKVNQSPASCEYVGETFDGSIEKFVDTLYPFAKQAAATLGVDVEVLIAQSALETGWGRKVNANQKGESSFNFFNIKADSRWQGDSVAVSTLEIRAGVPVRENADFRAYATPQHSFDDYVDFIGSSARYEKALQGEDAESYLRGLSEAGYATDSEYADKILQIIHSTGLKKAIKKAAIDAVSAFVVGD